MIKPFHKLPFTRHPSRFTEIHDDSGLLVIRGEGVYLKDADKHVRDLDYLVSAGNLLPECYEQLQEVVRVLDTWAMGTTQVALNCQALIDKLEGGSSGQTTS